MAGNHRRKVEDFDVSEFLRPSDEDMKSALSSILRSTPDSTSETDLAVGRTEAVSGESTVSEQDGAAGLNQPVPFPQTTPAPGGDLENSSESPPVISPREQRQTGEPSKLKVQKRGITPVDRSFDLSLHLRAAKTLFKLNRTELALYEMFLKWTHAVGSTTCQATNRKICETSGIEIKTVRRNLLSLRERNLIAQINAYDPYTHEPAVYEVHLPILPKLPDK